MPALRAACAGPGCPRLTVRRVPSARQHSFASQINAQHAARLRGPPTVATLAHSNGDQRPSASAIQQLEPAVASTSPPDVAIEPVEAAAAQIDEQDSILVSEDQDQVAAGPFGGGERQPLLVVFSGGTAFNGVAGPLRDLSTRVAHVLPVSDDGGSTAEIVRVLGGPAVGDIRSRCLRLADESDEESRAVKALLAHRLPSSSPAAAKEEWYQIVEGDHALWEGVSEPYKHTIRAFLVHFHVNILRHSSERFNFRNGSVGNFFFAGARTFFRSLEAAIFLFSRVSRIPEGSEVMPSILTEDRITLGAELEDPSASGPTTILRGQNQISHPSATVGPDGPEAVSKTATDGPLPGKIRRILYLSSEGTDREHEVFPKANPRVLQRIKEADAIIYGMGSLHTSICPSLILRGVGEEIAAREGVPKIMVLNGGPDRESTYSGTLGAPVEMTAADIVDALICAMNRRNATKGATDHAPSKYVTCVVVPRGGGIRVDVDRLAAMGVRRVLEADAEPVGEGKVHYDPDSLVDAIRVAIEEGVDDEAAGSGDGDARGGNGQARGS
ncbi:unnamed protein product [Pedinophyceae sp. YPF-701]|nr:unnamed protein product [Pedinophyceae sp. YPF-701]